MLHIASGDQLLGEVLEAECLTPLIALPAVIWPDTLQHQTFPCFSPLLTTTLKGPPMLHTVSS